MMKAARSLLERYSHISWALTDQAMVSGVNFLTGILLARFLGIREFGVYSLAWLSVLFVSSLQFAVIVSPMMSIGPKQTETEIAPYYGAVLAQQVIFSSFSFVLLYAGALASEAFGWHVAHLALPLALAALAFQMQDFLRRYFFTCNRAPAAFVCDAISYGGRLCMLIIISQMAILDSARALWIVAGTSALAALIAAFGFERPVYRLATFASVAKRHWQSSKWLTASTLLQWTSGNLFILATGAFLGVTAVGALKAAQNVIAVTHILFQGIENVLPVRSGAHYRRGGAQALVAYLRKVAWSGGVATAGIAALAWMFAEFWLQLLYGEEFRPFANLLRWYAVVYVVMFICLPLRIGLRTIEYTQPIFVGYLVTTLTTLVSIYPLIQYFGLSGVMTGMLGLQIIMLATLFTTWRKRILAREM